ncbi:hypothetical protein [Acholeplasma hippikon]|uniref:Uncharacterized protein n=1 Tax=Acholeplasma hippikon TaxID=264636 RepID=A0A449BJD7_9MOLU|nr:hypothetical protein [Acholeplasma hippikon]VEU82576.1 Uncharacterised protein [Acholeplasma hippikon]
MVPLHQPKSTFGKWLLKYRLILTILGIFILVPAAFVIALYVGDYLKYQKVTFDDVVVSKFEKSYLTTESSTNHEEINLENADLIVKIKLDSFLIPEYYDESGYYTFKAKYVEQVNKLVSSVQITLVLQTDWMDAKSNPYSISLSKNYSSQHSVAFNHILPQSPLWFVKVERPNLYVKVTYQIDLGLGQTELREAFFKTSLVGLTPSTEIDNNK